MAATDDKLRQLATLVLSSPQGLLATLAAVASTLALLYLLIFKDAAPTSNKASASRPKSNSARSSPTKQSPAKRSTPKKKSTPTPSPKESPSKTVAPGKSNSANKKANAAATSGADKKPNLTQKQATKLRQSNGSQKSNQNKDDGEWITVSSKKKVVRTKRQVEAPSPPQTRMSTRRINQNSQTPRRG